MQDYGQTGGAAPPASAKWKLPVICMLVGIILMSIALVLPWYQMSYEYDSSEGTMGAGADQFIHMDSGDQTKWSFVMSETLGMVGLVIGVIALMFLLISSLGGQPSKMPMIFTLIAAILCILAPMILMATLPGAFEADAKEANDDWEQPDHDAYTKSFFGSYEDKEDDSKDSWGGDVGWFLAIVAFVMFLLAFIFILRGKKTQAPAPMPPQQPPLQQQPPQQPMYPPQQPQYGAPPPQY